MRFHTFSNFCNQSVLLKFFPKDDSDFLVKFVKIFEIKDLQYMCFSAYWDATSKNLGILYS